MRFLDLGVLQIEVGDALLTPTGPRTTAVLSTLLLHLNQRVTIDLRADAAWDGHPPAHADEALASHVWRVRRLLEPSSRRRTPTSLVRRDGHAYRLSVPPEQVSSAQFEQLGSTVDQRLVDERPDRALQLADEALRLWRGAPYADLADRPWAEPAIARLERLQLQLQERRIGALIHLGDHERAITESDLLLQRHPLRERLWSQLMLACYRAGRLDEALGTYRRARRALRDEAAIDPGPELTRVHQQVLRRDPALDDHRAAPVTLAGGTVGELPDPRSLVGRAEDLAALDRALRAGRPLVSIIGPAGCGKTALASEAARASAGRHDGVWFVDLGATTASSPILEVVATTLGLSPSPRDGYTTSLRTFARHHSALLVLDNCEQVSAQVAAVCEVVLGDESRAQLLITSREPLGLAVEDVHHLQPLPTVGTSDDPADSPAAALFLRRDRLARSSDDLSDPERSAVGRICRATDGLPLALELAAGWTASYTMAEIADQVDRDPSALTALGGRRTAPHHTMHLAIDRSYQLLDPAEQALHRRLAVLPGPFSRPVAEELANDVLERHAVGGLLARLQHRSLLTATPHPYGTRFAQLATVRSHARHALAQAGETDAVEARRDAWTLDLFQRRPLGGRPEQAAWQAEILHDLPTVRATLERNLVTHPNALGAAVACRMLGFWFYRGHTAEGLHWLEQAAGRVVDDCYDRVIVHVALANVRGIAGDHAGALAAFDRAVAIVPDPLQQPADLAEALLALASVFAAAYDISAMRAALDLARSVVEPLRSPHLSVALDTLTCLADTADDPAAASVDRAFACVERAEAVGNLWAAWLACSSVNTIALARRDPVLGLEWSRRLIALQDRLGANVVLAQFETYADFLALRGDLEHSVQVLAASDREARRSGAPWPRNAMTPQLLADAREQLPGDRFDRAWTIGRGLSRAQLLEPLPSKPIAP